MIFATPQEHADNPPESWIVTGKDRLWRLTTKDGMVLETAKTKRQAESYRTQGFLAKLYKDEGRWFAGESVNGWKPYEMPTLNDNCGMGQ